MTYYIDEDFAKAHKLTEVAHISHDDYDWEELYVFKDEAGRYWVSNQSGGSCNSFEWNESEFQVVSTKAEAIDIARRHFSDNSYYTEFNVDSWERFKAAVNGD